MNNNNASWYLNSASSREHAMDARWMRKGSGFRLERLHGKQLNEINTFNCQNIKVNDDIYRSVCGAVLEKNSITNR